MEKAEEAVDSQTTKIAENNFYSHIKIVHTFML